MNTNWILKTFLAALGRRPLAEDYPQLKLYLSFETAPLEYPALVVSCSLEPAANLARNRTARFSATFSLLVPADDFSNDEHAALIAETDERLGGLFGAPETLNAYAEEIGAPTHFYSADWGGTSETQAEERLLSTAWTLSGVAQF